MHVTAGGPAAPMARVPFGSPNPSLSGYLLAFRDWSWLCSTILISFAADITSHNLPARRLLRRRWPIETPCSVLSHRLHRAFCMFLSPTAVLRGLAETHSSARTKVRHR